jgi:hypothetical protein
MEDDDDCGAVGGMIDPSAALSTTNPTWARTRVAAVEWRLLTARAPTRPGPKIYVHTSPVAEESRYISATATLIPGMCPQACVACSTACALCYVITWP